MGKITNTWKLPTHFEQSLGQRRNHKGIRKYLEYKKRKKYKTQKEAKAVLSPSSLKQDNRGESKRLLL